MADLILQTTTVLKGLLAWSGDIITFIMANPILLIPIIFGFVGAGVGITKKLMP